MKSTEEAKISAALILKDGEVFVAKGFGAQKIITGEIVFNTGMTGYQEVLTDPSYVGQIITFSFPHIGNVGINDQDNQDKKINASGLIVRNLPTNASNWRAAQDLNVWFEKNNVTGIACIDTRWLVKKIRKTHGGLYGLIAYDENGLDIQALKKKAAEIEIMEGQDLAAQVTANKNQELGNNPSLKVAVIDYGIKQGIIDNLVNVGCQIKVFPANVPVSEIKKFAPDGIFLSNGPGDPEATGKYSVPFIKEALKEGWPIFGICLGHQMLALALGAKTIKMKIGHRGENHPIKDLKTSKVYISSQNHGFCVDADSLPDDVQITHVSLFDGTIEGLKSNKYPAFSVQYHPEASPGPHDCRIHFLEFVELMKNAKKK